MSGNRSVQAWFCLLMTTVCFASATTCWPHYGVSSKEYIAWHNLDLWWVRPLVHTYIYMCVCAVPTYFFPFNQSTFPPRISAWNSTELPQGPEGKPPSAPNAARDGTGRSFISQRAPTAPTWDIPWGWRGKPLPPYWCLGMDGNGWEWDDES
jgi:hypothetical protein